MKPHNGRNNAWIYIVLIVLGGLLTQDVLKLNLWTYFGNEIVGGVETVGQPPHGNVTGRQDANHAANENTTAPATTVVANETAESLRPAPGGGRHQTGERVRFFAIHIGPSKTGTSTIQKDFTENPFAENTFGEEKDRVIYVGKRPFMDKDGREKNLYDGNRTVRTIDGKSITPRDEQRAYFKMKHCMMEQLDARDPQLVIDDEAKASLREKFLKDCWNKYQGGKYRYMLDYSIIDSDEGYSYRNKKRKKTKSATFLKLIQVFDILGYDKLVVVAAYRRYAQWLVSVFHQNIKVTVLFGNLDGKRQQHMPPIIKSFLVDHVNHTNETNYDGKGVGKKYRNLDQSLAMIRKMHPSTSKLDVKILNFM